ncbi:MAG: ATP-dependent helicase HrpB [Planctomycetota bacterium]
MKLPVDAILPHLLELLQTKNTVVVTAPPGSGKTTRIPPALMKSLGPGKILVSQPRRIAARASAARMAMEDQSALGTTFGFRTRFESKVSPSSKVVVMTEGLLARIIQSDPFLNDVSCIVLDEFHERSVDLDLSLAFLKEIMAEVRPDLKLVIMSATLEVEPLVNYLDAATIVADARLFPITMTHDQRRDERPLDQRVASAVLESLQENEGDILVFLSGIGSIRQSRRRLEALGVDKLANIFELHGELDASVQDSAITPSQHRKVILSTNVAETSVTVPNVRQVVDTGLAKVLRHDQNLGLDRLEEERISLASARQRSGRAGREGPGFARRLWTLAEERQMAEQQEAEIGRLDLASAVLQILDWGAASAYEFDWFERPALGALDAAVELLRLLGAVDLNDGKMVLTRRGKGLCALPLHPRLGVLLRESERLGVGEEGAISCALLGERDILNMSVRRELGRKFSANSDLQLRIDLLDARDSSIHRGAGRRIYQIAKGLRRHRFHDRVETPSDTEEALARAILMAFPDRVARRRASQPNRARMVGGRGLSILDESTVGDSEFFCALRLSAGRRGQGSDSPVTWISAIKREWLEECYPAAVFTKDAGEFDVEKARVFGFRRSYFHDLVLDEKTINLADGVLSGEILAEAVRLHPQLALSMILDDATRSLVNRSRFLRAHCPEQEWPEWTDEELVDRIATLCPGKYRMSELQGAPLRNLLESEIGFRSLSILKKEAPKEFKLPNGRRVSVEYEDGLGPKIASKVQDFFGLTKTPLFAFGRVRARVELLAPNRRPVQVTSDLESFWTGTYQLVRKDLRGRYPKHDWPELPPGC